MIPCLENLLKLVVVRLPSESIGVISKLGFRPFRGLIAPSFGLYSSSERADTGASGAIFVARICLLCNSLSCGAASLSPIFFTGSYLKLLNLSICCDSKTLVFTLKFLLSTTIFEFQSSISFCFWAYISTIMSSPLMKTVLKNALFENVVTPFTFFTKSGLPSSSGRYTLSYNLLRVSSFCK